MIRVNEDYIIDVDSMNYIPKIDKHYTKTDNKTGKEYDVFVTLGYYTTLSGALERVKEDMYKNCITEEIVSLETALKELQRVNKSFEEVFNKVMGE